MNWAQTLCLNQIHLFHHSILQTTNNKMDISLDSLRPLPSRGPASPLIAKVTKCQCPRNSTSTSASTRTSSSAANRSFSQKDHPLSRGHHQPCSGKLSTPPSR